MTVSSVGSGAAGTSGTSSTGSSGTATGSSATTTASSNQLDENTFLKLLVAQLKYQDPSNPTDPSQFLSQTAQFTQVQTMTAIQALDQKVYDSSQQSIATSMIGKTVTWTDVSGNARTGLVTGVSVGATNPNLTVGGNPVPLASVSQVSATAPAAAGTTSSSAGA